MPAGADRRLREDPEPRRHLPGGQLVDVAAVEQDRARARLQEPGERAQQRRLAARVGADDRRHPAGRDRHVSPLAHLAVVVREREVLGREGAVGAHSPVPARLARIEQPHEIGRAEDAGDDADRQLGRAGDHAREQVGDDEQHGSGARRRQQREVAASGPAGGRSVRRRMRRRRSGRPPRCRTRPGRTPQITIAARDHSRRTPTPRARSSPRTIARSEPVSSSIDGTSTATAMPDVVDLAPAGAREDRRSATRSPAAAPGCSTRVSRYEVTDPSSAAIPIPTRISRYSDIPRL